MGSNHSSYDPSNRDGDNARPAWMGSLDDGMSIASVSLPGTHNTGTWPGCGGDLVRCQSWNLQKQLSNGIRFLDIRGRHIDDTLQIYHGIVPQNLSMSDIIIPCVEFLDDHPGEFIVIRFGGASTPENNTRSYLETLMTYLTPANKFWTKTCLPTIEAARGKIIILDNNLIGTGIPYDIVKDEDDYVVRTILKCDINKKWRGVRSHVTEARERDLGTMYVSFTSGASCGAYPNAIAYFVNPRAWTFLEKNPGKYRWGTIVMDFPGQTLIDNIINSNF